MSVIEIEKGVPIPANAGAPGRKRVYPFPQMSIGDSFFVGGSSASEARRVAGVLRRCAYVFRKKVAGCRFFICLVDGGVRVWRIE